MSSKFFDIPFRTRSNEGDFNCRDGEILSAKGVSIQNDGIAIDSAAYNKEGDYDESENHEPPAPEISFTLVRDILPGWNIHPDVYPSKTVAATDPSMDYWTGMAAQVLALFKNEAEYDSLFVAPFYAMAAWKTPEGHYLSPSVPVLLTPNSEVPVVTATGDLGASELQIKIAGAVCSIRIKTVAPEVLRDWVGKISSLEILVSEPLSTYDSFRSFVPQRSGETSAWCECLDLETGEIAKRRICMETLSPLWKAIENKKDPDLNKSSLKFFTYASIPLREVDLLGNWTNLADEQDWLKAGYWGESVKNSELEKQNIISWKPGPAVIGGLGEDIELITRPLKLSEPGEFKKVRKIFLRGCYTPALICMTIEGSRDMLDWWKIAERQGGTMVMLPRSWFRFYRVRVTGVLRKGEGLEGLSLK